MEVIAFFVKREGGCSSQAVRQSPDLCTHALTERGKKVVGGGSE